MSFVEGLEAGRRAGESLYAIPVGRGSNPLVAYTAMVNRGRNYMGGHINAAAIRAQAAQAAIEEKKLALEERKQALAEQVAADAAWAKREELRQQKALRESAIIKDQEDIAGKREERWAKGAKESRESEAYERAKDIQNRKNAFPQFMQGVYGKNPALVKDYLNRYGSETANVKDVTFSSPEIDPKNPEGMIITYEDGTSSFFKDPKDFYQNFAALVDPKIEEAIYTRRLKESEEVRKKAKAEREQQEFEGKTPLTKKELADLRTKALKAYKDDPEIYDKATGEKKPGVVSEEQYVKDYIKKAAGEAPGAEGEEKGAGYKEFKAPDGRVKREYDDGRVEILKDGKVIAAKDKSGNVINPGPRAQRKGSTIDYGTGEMTPEGEAEIEAEKQKAAKPKAEAERKAAIKGEEPIPTGTAEYTDKRTGHQMRVTVYSDGTTKTEKIESKKKRKKKKEGNGSGEGNGGGGD